MTRQPAARQSRAEPSSAVSSPDFEPAFEARPEGLNHLVSEHADGLLPRMAERSLAQVLRHEREVVAIREWRHSPWLASLVHQVGPPPVGGVLPVERDEACVPTWEDVDERSQDSVVDRGLVCCESSVVLVENGTQVKGQ